MPKGITQPTQVLPVKQEPEKRTAPADAIFCQGVMMCINDSGSKALTPCRLLQAVFHPSLHHPLQFHFYLYKSLHPQKQHPSS